MYLYMDTQIYIYHLIYKHMYRLHLILLSCSMLFLNTATHMCINVYIYVCTYIWIHIYAYIA